MSKKPVRVAVTGAAGQIGYALLFRIASGDMLGKDQPVILQLLEIPDEKAQKALKGVMMELEDCAFPLLAGMEAHADPMTAFKNTDYALLVGSRPRGPGMERAELLSMNGAIFTAQGKALDAAASRNVKVLVHAEEVSDRIVGVMGGYIRWSGLVEEPTHAIQVTERLSGRQLDPFAREVIMNAHTLR